MYSGAPTSSSALQVRGNFYPQVGNYVCVNGSVSGPYCNTYLEVENVCHTYSAGVRTCHLNQTRSSDPTKSGVQGGDSGGPVYRPGSGGALAVGIIDGSGGDLAWYTPIHVLHSRWSVATVTG